MNAYIYRAEMLCEACALRIIAELDDSLKLATGITQDSDLFPQGPYTDGGGEADSPAHCGRGEQCVNAIKLSTGIKVGCFLENPLTQDGYRYVIEQAIERPTTEVSGLWVRFYSPHLRYDSDRREIIFYE